MSEQTPTTQDPEPQQGQAPEPPAPTQEPPPPPAPALELPEDDAGLDAALNESAIELPDGGKMVDGQRAAAINMRLRSQRDKLREELASLKPNAEKASHLEGQIATLQAQIQQLQPYVQAYLAMTQAAQQAAEPQQEPVAREEAERWARRYDLYQPDGTPDLERASEIIRDYRRTAREEAERVAKAHVAPIYQQSVQQQAAYNMARAKNTVLPNGAKADPQMIEAVWARLDPSLTATPEGARQALMMAFAYSQALARGQAAPGAPAAGPARAPNGQFQAPAPQAPIPDPMFTERAGGLDTPASAPLSDHERKYIKDVGMSEKEYLDTVKSAPWMRR